MLLLSFPYVITIVCFVNFLPKPTTCVCVHSLTTGMGLVVLWELCPCTYIQAMNDFKERLTDIQVNFTEIRFRTGDGIDGINTEFLVSSYMLIHYTTRSAMHVS